MRSGGARSSGWKRLQGHKVGVGPVAQRQVDRWAGSGQCVRTVTSLSESHHQPRTL